MYKEINLTITEHSYLKELAEFNKETLIKDFAKVVQLKWDKDALQCPVRKKLYAMYVKEVASIAKARGHTLESRKELLKDWVNWQKEKKPELFNKIGWYDLNIARVLEETKEVGKDVGTS
jgi:hypothetical protein